MKITMATMSPNAEESLNLCSTLSPTMFLTIMNRQYGKCVGTTKVKKHSIVNRLYWSPSDQAYFVAIQNLNDGKVLTVLNLETYCAYFPQKISSKKLAAVTNEMVIAGEAPEWLWRRPSRAQNVLVYATVAGFACPLALGRWRMTMERFDLSLLGAQKNFWRWIANKISARGAALENLEWVTARLSGGDHQYLTYNC